ncbi:MAG TPA: FAD-binding protein [Gaiellaceae bacterium]|jgi:FAD/FMN-containing dehydrogenase
MLVWNGNVARVPALVVRPDMVEELAAVVEFARDHGLPLKLRGESQGGAETPVDDRAVTLDLSRLEAERGRQST